MKYHLYENLCTDDNTILINSLVKSSLKTNSIYVFPNIQSALLHKFRSCPHG